MTLTVTDDKGAADTVQAEVQVKALPVTVYFSPRTLNLKSKDPWVTATLDGATGITTLNVVGEISSNGTHMEFSGAGTITAYEKKKISFFRKYLMKQIMGFYSKGGSKDSKSPRH